MAVTRGVGFGIVGIGVIAGCHAQAIRAMRGGRLVGAFSRHGGPQTAVFAERYNTSLYVQDYDAFLAHPQLDVVVILTPFRRPPGTGDCRRQSWQAHHVQNWQKCFQNGRHFGSDVKGAMRCLCCG